jgi:phosphatidylserine/phosphatidylglycerophosphate/cardiolipin synthase-like enzyme
MNITISKLCILTLLFYGCNVQPTYKEPPPIHAEPDQNSCPMPNNVQWDIHFSPNGGATANLVTAINGATKSIYVQAYSFTSAPIALALVNAHNRGVHVEVILDKSDVTGKGTVLPMLRGHGIPTFIDDKHAIAHNKIMIIDQVTVFTGSFNFTNAAEHSNAENSIRLTYAKIATVYQENWNAHRAHSQ